MLLTGFRQQDLSWQQSYSTCGVSHAILQQLFVCDLVFGNRRSPPLMLLMEICSVLSNSDLKKQKAKTNKKMVFANVWFHTHAHTHTVLSEGKHLKAAWAFTPLSCVCVCAASETNQFPICGAALWLGASPAAASAATNIIWRRKRRERERDVVFWSWRRQSGCLAAASLRRASWWFPIATAPLLLCRNEFLGGGTPTFTRRIV